MACRPLMCWSTGREPMAQPPGSDTRARPKRASNGPSTRMDARMVLTSSYGASGLATPPASSVTRSGLSSWRRATTPILASSLNVVDTSCNCGTLARVTGSALNSVAHRSGKAAFLAPEIVTSPWRRRPPRIRSLSMKHRGRDAPTAVEVAPELGVTVKKPCAADSGLRCPLGGRQGLHRQRMDLLPHSIAEGLVNALVAHDTALAFELAGDDGGKEVLPIAFYGEVGARQAGGNVLLDPKSTRLNSS